MRRRILPIVLCGLLLAGPLIPAAAGPDEGLERAAELEAAADWAAAVEAYRAVTHEDPERAEAWAGLGRALRALERFDESVAAFGRALAAGADERQAMLESARTLAAAGDSDGAVEWLGRLAGTGSTAGLRVANLPEFAALVGTPAFDRALDALRPCRAPEYRQFDFWVGDWDVVNKAARVPRPPSHNRISSVQGGCALLEEYDTPSGYTGVSLSYYDAGDGTWSQTWIDNQGQPIVHSGRFEDGKIILLDTPAEGHPLNRTTWAPLRDGRVRQHWESSTDGGGTWKTVFDGLYTRRSGPSSGNEASGKTDNRRLAELLKRIVGEVEGEDGHWAFEYSGVPMMLIADEEWNRMRLIAPVVERDEVGPQELAAMLEANFGRALDAKYALWRGGVWSTYAHPLGELSRDQLISAMRQVAALHRNYGTSYSSTDIVFEGEGGP